MTCKSFGESTKTTMSSAYSKIFTFIPPHLLLEEDIQPAHLYVKKIVLDSEYIPVAAKLISLTPFGEIVEWRLNCPTAGPKIPSCPTFALILRGQSWYHGPGISRTSPLGSRRRHPWYCGTLLRCKFWPPFHSPGWRRRSTTNPHPNSRFSAWQL